MDHRGSTPPGALRPPDVVAAVEASAPSLSVYLTTDAAVENAAQRSEYRWKTMRNDLARRKVPDAVLVAVDPVVSDAHLHGGCLGVIAGEDGIRLLEHGNDPPPGDVATWEPLPHLLPMLQWRQSAPPYVLVLADRSGAELVTVANGHADEHIDAGGVDGPLTKSAPGGWSQRRYQQRAENTWEHNATEVARELERLVERSRARLVLVAGDVRARQLLRDELATEVQARLEEIPGGRAEDGSAEHTAAEAAKALARATSDDTNALLAKFREERGQHDRAAEGVDATVEALRRAQVEVLLVSERFDLAPRAWFGDDGVHLATSADELRGLGVEQPQEAPLVDVLVRSALCTGAGIRVVHETSAPADGVGAILRWSA